MLLVIAPYLPRIHVDVVQRCAVLCAVPATPLAALPFFIRSMHRSKSSPHQCALPQFCNQPACLPCPSKFLCRVFPSWLGDARPTSRRKRESVVTRDLIFVAIAAVCNVMCGPVPHISHVSSPRFDISSLTWLAVPGYTLGLGRLQSPTVILILIFYSCYPIQTRYWK